MSAPVVVGAGLAGLVAAAALRRTHPHVVLVERDHLSPEAAERRGVPQGRQLHNVLTRAQHHLDALLPGFTDRLVEMGGAAATVGSQTHVFELGVQMPRRDVGLRLLSAPRPLIDQVARGLLHELGGIEERTGWAARHLRVEDNRVVGVGLAGPSGFDSIQTPLVIDAAGPMSPTPRWLGELGLRPPRREESHPEQWYVTQVLARPPSRIADDHFWLVFPWRDDARGALLSPVGTDRWYLSVSGRRRDPIPRSWAEIVAHAASVADPTVGELVQHATPVGAQSTFRRTVATWWRYDELEAPVGGLVPIGDAVACLNPLYGQGMSVASWQASLLADVLADAEDPSSSATAAAAHRSFAGAVSAAWDLDELVQQAVITGPGGESWIRDRIVHDPEVHRRYIGIWHLIEPASWLFDLAASSVAEEAHHDHHR